MFPLNTAVQSNQIEVVHLLLQHQATVQIYGNSPPLYSAVRNQNEEMVRLLCSVPNFNPNGYGWDYVSR